MKKFLNIVLVLLVMCGLAVAQTSVVHATRNRPNTFTEDNTFTKPVAIATPTQPGHAATKAYVDAGGAVSTAYSFGIQSPATTDSGLYQHKYPRAYAVQTVSCSTDQGTASINLNIRTATTPNTPGTDVLASSLICDNDSASTSVIASPNVSADSVVAVDVTGTTGTPGVVRIHITIQ